MQIASFLHELQAILIRVAFHEPHEPIPLPRAPHYVLGFDRRRLSIDELGVHIHRLNSPFLVGHVEPGDLTKLARRVENRRLLEPERGDPIRAVPRFR